MAQVGTTGAVRAWVICLYWTHAAGFTGPPPMAMHFSDDTLMFFSLDDAFQSCFQLMLRDVSSMWRSAVRDWVDFR